MTRPFFIVAIRFGKFGYWKFHAAFAPNAYDLAYDAMFRIGVMLNQNDAACLVDWQGNYKEL